MNHLYINTAGLTIEVRFHPTEKPFILESDYLHKIKDYFSGFITESPLSKPSYTINLYHHNSVEIFTKDKKKSLYIKLFEEISEKKYHAYYHLSEEQFQLLIRTIIQKEFSKGEGLILHGSAVIINGQSNLFLGKSGAGKSTIMKMLSKFGKGVADDSFFVKREKSGIRFYSSTAREKNWLEKKSQGYEIANIFFLRKSKYHRISKISKPEKIIELLLNQLYTTREDSLPQTNFILNWINQSTNFYILDFSLKQPKKLIEIIASQQ